MADNGMELARKKALELSSNFITAYARRGPSVAGHELQDALFGFLSAPATPSEGLVLEWRDGAPPKPWSQEWFIAVTTYGDKVVLRALPDEWTYGFKTADDTYIMADKIKKWMQFPESNFIAPEALLSAPATPTDPGLGQRLRERGYQEAPVGHLDPLGRPPIVSLSAPATSRPTGEEK